MDWVKIEKICSDSSADAAIVLENFQASYNPIKLVIVAKMDIMLICKFLIIHIGQFTILQHMILLMNIFKRILCFGMQMVISRLNYMSNT